MVKKKKKFKVVSLFSGCGGLDLGFINAGFEVIWANDFSPDAVETYKKNIGEHMYLDEFYHFLKFVKRRMLMGFETKEAIKEDWIRKWNPNEEDKGISSFGVGAERIVYSLFNTQGFGQPNSSPIGSDLFFETHDAFIHIDLKTVQTRNIGDYSNDIFVGDNQNSYIEINESEKNKMSFIKSIYDSQ